MHRNIEGAIKAPAIKREGRKYYAVFTTINEIRIPEVENTNPVGIDPGLDSFVAMSDGTKIEKLKFMQQKEVTYNAAGISKRLSGRKQKRRINIYLL